MKNQGCNATIARDSRGFVGGALRKLNPAHRIRTPICENSSARFHSLNREFTNLTRMHLLAKIRACSSSSISKTM